VPDEEATVAVDEMAVADEEAAMSKERSASYVK
jgi:hypothetical protein